MYKNTKYPSIQHLPKSKMGADDKGIHIGMSQYCESKYRENTRIIVTEKVDGSNVSIINDNGEIIALSRGGYKAEFSNYQHHRNFAEKVKRMQLTSNDIPIGERVVFEDLTVPHGTIYKNAPDLLLIDWKTKNGHRLWNEYESFKGIPKVVTIYNGIVPVRDL